MFAKSKNMHIFISMICLMLFSSVYANNDNLAIGKQLYETRCIMCHGEDARATGPLAQKSSPPTPDLTSVTFQNRLKQCPGLIVTSLVFSPNKKLILGTLKANGIVLPHHVWTDDELRSINQYVLTLIAKHNQAIKNHFNNNNTLH